MGTSLKGTLAFAAVSLLIPSAASAATATARVDFEGLTEGSVASVVSSGSGVSGTAFGGSIAVLGTNPTLTGNAALVFDATCSLAGGGFEGPGAGGSSADCSGGDGDLFQPANSKVLIVAERLEPQTGGRVEEPDDADNTSQLLDLDLSGFGPGTFDVTSVDILDVDGNEKTGRVIAYRDGVEVGSVAIPTSGDGTVQTLLLGFTQVDALRFDLAGSGAIDNLELVGAVEEQPPGEQPPGEQPPPTTTVQQPPTTTVQQPPPTTVTTPPSGGVLPETVLSGRARLLQPSGCVRGSFTVRVRGRSIASVRFAVNGKRVKKVRRPNARGAFAVRINSVKYGVGAHKLTARVRFESGSGTAPRTLTGRFFRCAQTALPRFTG
jgi:hypothetical protein